jgi:transposase InsO family protein
MREQGLLAPGRAGHPHGPKAHDGTIIPDRPNELWGTDMTTTLTRGGTASIFFVIDHCTAECLGIHAAKEGTRLEALEPLRQAVRRTFGTFTAQIAGGTLGLRHDHGSQFMSDLYQEELRFLGIRSTPAFIGEPEGNGCAERFVRTLKEQLLWLFHFPTIQELNTALQAFRERYNHTWLIQRHGHRTPDEHRQALVGPVEVAA